MSFLGGKKSTCSPLFQTTDFMSIAAATVCGRGVKRILPPPLVVKGRDWVYPHWFLLDYYVED